MDALPFIAMDKLFDFAWILIVANGEQQIEHIILGDSPMTTLLEWLSQTNTQELPHADWLDIHLNTLSRWLRNPLEKRPDLPFKPQGTAFQQAVWTYLGTIPLGQTRSYAEVAQAIHHPRACRAVALACARNPLALWVPCHRVVRSNGQLGGYYYGSTMKQLLLEWEHQFAPIDSLQQISIIQ